MIKISRYIFVPNKKSPYNKNSDGKLYDDEITCNVCGKKLRKKDSTTCSSSGGGCGNDVHSIECYDSEKKLCLDCCGKSM
jgi:CRISPR/Cas system-associated protein Cas10 (large subunit of type III CRISPR-Cas system)